MATCKQGIYVCVYTYVCIFYYIDTDEIPGFFLLLKNHIFIARSEDTIFSFTCEDIGVAMVTNMISQLQESFPLRRAGGSFEISFTKWLRGAKTVQLPVTFSMSCQILTSILSALEDKIRIPARPCNILYFYTRSLMNKANIITKDLPIRVSRDVGGWFCLLISVLRKVRLITFLWLVFRSTRCVPRLT